MNAKTLGDTIAKLRKQKGMTQSNLASKLNVSDKAVSKWENGQGYPDITLLPSLASLFNVSIDYILLGERKGITIAGNIIADVVKNIDCYPEIGMLTNVSQVTPAVGGCAPNTSIDLAKIDPSLPVSVVGKIGSDENGRFILSQLRSNGIDVNNITYSKTASTAFCDVMNLPSGERTFFHKAGANAEFSPEDIDLDSLNCDIFHIGYILLLDKFDEKDPEYGTVMARFLHSVQERGIKTSVDVVSNSTNDYAEKIIPALKYCNYVIINELECSRIWDLNPRDADGKLNIEVLKTAMQKTAEAGVRDKVIVHSKEMGLLLDVSTNEFVYIPSLKIPKEEILGSVGAGDAFCAGSLYGLYNDFSNEQILEFASCAAACNLFAANAVDGMKSKNEILKMEEKYGRLSL